MVVVSLKDLSFATVAFTLGMYFLFGEGENWEILIFVREERLFGTDFVQLVQSIHFLHSSFVLVVRLFYQL